VNKAVPIFQKDRGDTTRMFDATMDLTQMVDRALQAMNNTQPDITRALDASMEMTQVSVVFSGSRIIFFCDTF
jgi:hypothetical protein